MMRPECIESVKKIAESFGRVLTATDLRGMEGKITQARKLVRLDMGEKAFMALSEQQIMEKVGKRITDDATFAAARRKRTAATNIIKKAERTATREQLKASGLTDMEALAYDTFVINDGRGRVTSLEERVKGMAHDYLRRLEGLRQLQDESSFAGIEVHKQAGISFIDESFGKDSRDAKVSKVWREVKAVLDEMRAHINRAGGDVAELANYHLPQAADPYAVSRKMDKYVTDHMDWVDRERYVNPDGTLMDDTQMHAFLREAAVTIATDGANKAPGKGGSKLAKAHRQIHYKSPEAYRAAMGKYGAGNAFEQVFNHVESMAQEIAVLEHLGTNAVAEWEAAYADAVKATGKERLILKRAFERMTGQSKKGSAALHHWTSEIKSTVVAARLGSMLFAQLADMGSAMAVTRTLGIPVSELMGWAGRVAKDAELRKTLRYHGIGIESALNSISRFAEGASARGLMGRIAGAVPTLQGAHLWTKTWRQAFGAMLEAKMGDLVTKYDFNTLPEADRLTMQKLGVDEATWKIWSKATPIEYRGSRLMGPDAIMEISSKDLVEAGLAKTVKEADVLKKDAAVKFTGMVVEQSHQAVLQPGALSGATLDYERGTPAGELFGLLTQFKQFPMAWLRQAFIERANFTGQNPWVFRAKLLATTTVLGGISLVLNDMADGKDPRKIYDEDDPTKAASFAFQAMMKGGGLGFMNEVAELVLYGTENPYQSGSKLLGPSIGHLAGNIVPAIGKGGKALFTQDEKDVESFTKYLYSSVKGVTPGQNLWFMKGFIHNVLLDELQEMANPGYKKRAKKRAMENYGQGSWIEEQRAPDLNVLEQ